MFGVQAIFYINGIKIKVPFLYPLDREKYKEQNVLLCYYTSGPNRSNRGDYVHTKTTTYFDVALSLAVA